MTMDAKVEPSDSVKTSVETPPEPSTPTKMIPQEEVDKLIGERHSTLDKKVAELTKSVEAQSKAAQLAEERAAAAEEILARAEDARAEAEFRAIPPDNTDALSLYQQRMAHKQAVRDFEAAKKEHEKSVALHAAELAEAQSFKALKVASDIVAKPEYAGINPSDLVELTDGSPDKMESLAKKLAAGKTVITPTNQLGYQPETLPYTDLSSGASGEPTMEQRENMTMEQLIANPSIQKRIYK